MLNSSRISVAAATTVILLASSACTHLGPGAANFQGCPTSTNGVACMSAREVYEATDDRDQLSSEDMPAKSKQKHQHEQGEARPYAEYRHAPTLPAVNGPIPVRTPSEVMRIRLNYWQSKDGNLHVPGYIYTEIVKRRWQMGLKAPERAPSLHPLQTLSNPSSSQASTKSPVNMKDEATASLQQSG